MVVRQVAAASVHLDRNAKLLGEIRGIQQRLERASPSLRQGESTWDSKGSSPH
jgi:hypothetical protein